jgi:peptide chain release factor subunit 1
MTQIDETEKNSEPFLNYHNSRSWQDYNSALSILKEKCGNGTELISLYIPGTKQLHEVTNRLRDELAGCGNIKSKQTRTHVQRALNSMISRLSQMKIMPENGIIIFCGEVIIRGDKTEFEYHTVTPPTPVKSFSYRCNSRFETGDAENLSANGDSYGLVVLDLHESCWGVLTGSDLRVAGTFDSLVPSKHCRGGQSAPRFERLRDIAINGYFVKLGSRVNDAFLPLLKDRNKLKSVIIGGCGLTKDQFVKGGYLNHELRKLIVGTFDTQYTNEYGLTELVSASKEKISNTKTDHQKEQFNEFLVGLSKDTGRSIYGIPNILTKIQNGQIKQVLISSKRNDLYIQVSEQTVNKGVSIEIISSDSESGSTMDTAFGGMVAIARY